MNPGAEQPAVEAPRTAAAPVGFKSVVPRSGAVPDYRTFRSDTGKSEVRGVVDSFDQNDGVVRIRLENGRSTVVPINRLSAEDRDHIYKSGWGQPFRNTELPQRAIDQANAKRTRGLTPETAPASRPAPVAPPAAAQPAAASEPVDGPTLPNPRAGRATPPAEQELVLPGMPVPSQQDVEARRREIAISAIEAPQWAKDYREAKEKKLALGRSRTRGFQRDLALDSGDAMRKQASREARAAAVAEKTVRASKPTNAPPPMTTPLPLSQDEQDLEKYRADANTEASAYREGYTVPQPGTAAWDAQARNMDRSSGMNEEEVEHEDWVRGQQDRMRELMGKGEMNPQQPMEQPSLQAKREWDKFSRSTPALRERYHPAEVEAAHREDHLRRIEEKYGPEVANDMRAGRPVDLRTPEAKEASAQRKQWEKDLHSPDKQVRDAARSQLAAQDARNAQRRRASRDGTPVYDKEGQLVGVRGGTRNTPGWKAMEARDALARDVLTQRAMEKAGNAGVMIDRALKDDPQLMALNAQFRNAPNEDAQMQAGANIRALLASRGEAAKAAAEVEAARVAAAGKPADKRGGNPQETVDAWLTQNAASEESFEAQQNMLAAHLLTQHPELDEERAMAVAAAKIAGNAFRAADQGTLTTPGREFLRQTIYRADPATGKVGARMTAEEFAHEAARHGIPASKAAHIYAVITGQKQPAGASDTAVAAADQTAYPPRGDM
jgi:hypothetical protein